MAAQPLTQVMATESRWRASGGVNATEGLETSHSQQPIAAQATNISDNRTLLLTCLAPDFCSVLVLIARIIRDPCVQDTSSCASPSEMRMLVARLPLRYLLVVPRQVQLGTILLRFSPTPNSGMAQLWMQIPSMRVGRQPRECLERAVFAHACPHHWKSRHSTLHEFPKLGVDRKALFDIKGSKSYYDHISALFEEGEGSIFVSRPTSSMLSHLTDVLDTEAFRP
ncbi:hypothetical protein BKA62DRAFT_69821 [Auriculariales sp. MPI-PUGE-AT-0066]|nr:hypothetical protein BKA62DRAFT_69821 [Auriculariales sp. MPI-PUGE-AT-0066]